MGFKLRFLTVHSPQCCASLSWMFEQNTQLLLTLRFLHNNKGKTRFWGMRKETGSFLPNKWFLGNTPVKKHQALKEIYLNRGGKIAHEILRNPLGCMAKNFRVEKGISSSVIAADNDKFVAALSTGTCPCQQMRRPGMDTLKYCANSF